MPFSVMCFFVYVLADPYCQELGVSWHFWAYEKDDGSHTIMNGQLLAVFECRVP